MKRLLPLLLLLISSTTLAESGAYRVEVIIFQNLEATADATPVDELRSFSRFPALEENNLPDDLVVIDKKSRTMNAVWRRLKSSRAYRPLLFAAWEQNRTDYYPPMRIHDDVLLGKQLRPPTNIMIADLTAADPLAAYISSFYRLDGSVQLRRSRFLHLYLDLEIREETVPTGADAINDAASDAAGEPLLPDNRSADSYNNYSNDNPINNDNDNDNGDDDSDDSGTSYSLYSLQQNRPIRTGRMQYFDMPYFGALVLVSAIDSE